MKKFLFFILFSSALYAQSYLISTIPIPLNYAINTDIEICREECLIKLLKDEKFFSFLTRADGNLEDELLNEQYQIYSTLFNIHSTFNGENIRISLLVPHKTIGRYAFSVSQTVFAYLLAKNQPFNFKIYHIEDEKTDSINEALIKIQDDGFKHVIAPFTLTGARNTVELENIHASIYFPTINQSDINIKRANFYYGGIDYRKQIEKLSAFSQNKIALFYDDGALGNSLNRIIEDQMDINSTVVFKKGISHLTTNLSSSLENNLDLKDSTVFLNTPIIKSGLVMSQLTLYDNNVSNILSTQINYDPLLLNITQHRDRKNMLIANSIDSKNNFIAETNALFKNNITYDWINFSATLGVDYFYHIITRKKREYGVPFVENQLEYPIQIIRPTASGFMKIISEEAP